MYFVLRKFCKEMYMYYFFSSSSPSLSRVKISSPRFFCLTRCKVQLEGWKLHAWRKLGRQRIILPPVPTTPLPDSEFVIAGQKRFSRFEPSENALLQHLRPAQPALTNCVKEEGSPLLPCLRQNRRGRSNIIYLQIANERFRRVPPTVISPRDPCQGLRFVWSKFQGNERGVYVRIYRCKD